MAAIAYSDMSCSSYISYFVYSLPSVPLANGWMQASATGVALPEGTQSVAVVFDIAPDTTFGSAEGSLDHVMFGPAGTTPVRLQSFDVK